MKTLINLSASATESDWSDSRKSVAAIHHELSPGVFVHVGLGASGLQVFHGQKAVGIPLDEIMKLVRIHEPLIGSHTPALASPAKV